MLRQGSELRARIGRSAEGARDMLPMLVSIGLVGTGSAMLTTAVSLALSDPEAAPLAVQFVLTAYPVGFLLGCLVARPMVSRFGHERTFLLVTILGALAASGFLFAHSMPAWFCFRLLGGLAMSSLFIVCESWINLFAGQHNRGRYFGVYMLTTAIAVLVGQLLVAALGPHSGHLFPASALVMLLGVLSKVAGPSWPGLALAQQQSSQSDRAAQGERFGLLQLARLAPVTVVSIFQAGVTNLNIYVLTPLYGAQIGLSASTIVGLVTTISIAGMLAQTPVGWLSDRFDRRLILLVQGVLSVTFCAAIAFLGNRFEPLLFALFFLYGATALTVYPVAIAFANSRLESRHMVSASGALLLLYSVGNIIAPGLAAGLMQRTAPQAMFLVLGAGAVLVALAACLNLARRSAGPGPAAIPASSRE